jgi:hypothetical protein
VIICSRDCLRAFAARTRGPDRVPSSTDRRPRGRPTR